VGVRTEGSEHLDQGDQEGRKKSKVAMGEEGSQKGT